jgi:hypothetical protein
MNLLCPNCGKMLTVPEQYAGQMMKCPLCSGTFTVPALPGGAEPPPPAQPAAPEPPTLNPYEVRQEGPAEPVPAFATTPPPEPAFSTAAPPEPAFKATPPPAPPSTATTPAGPTPARGPDAAGQPLPSLGYRGGFGIPISDKVLRWVVPASLVLIFFLTFFDWVGIYPGSVPAVWQSAWGAAFGTYGDDPDLQEFYRLEPDSKKKRLDVSVSPLLILYLLPFFILALLLAIAVAVLPFLKLQLPPPVQQFLPWQWAALAGLNAILLLFLVLQMLLGFGLENSYKEWVENRLSTKKEKEPDTSKVRKEIDVQRGQYLQALSRTIWLKLALLLQFIATVAAALVFWVEKRGPAAPLPSIDVKW